MCDMDGFHILHSERLIPVGDERLERNMWVSVVLETSKMNCCKNGGKLWNPISSYVVSAWLTKRSDQILAASASRKSQLLYESVVSVKQPLIGQAKKVRTSSLMTYMM